MDSAVIGGLGGIWGGGQDATGEGRGSQTPRITIVGHHYLWLRGIKEQAMAKRRGLRAAYTRYVELLNRFLNQTLSMGSKGAESGDKDRQIRRLFHSAYSAFGSTTRHIPRPR